ncbi:hypothetical protein [Carnobacterium iners]|uniref:hypothetical protein n=1 Tax=Carnobacterium iners TaxID=1073423 RepID=UPI001F414153|nr:hypothetical protein [Carnobacterium iners]
MVAEVFFRKKTGVIISIVTISDQMGSILAAILAANNIILNVGRAVGGFSSVSIRIILDKFNLLAVMLFLSALYLFSFIIMMSNKGLKKESYQNPDYQVE